MAHLNLIPTQEQIDAINDGIANVGYTQREIGKMLGWDGPSVSMFLHSGRPIDAYRANLLYRILGKKDGIEFLVDTPRQIILAEGGSLVLLIQDISPKLESLRGSKLEVYEKGNIYRKVVEPLLIRGVGYTHEEEKAIKLDPSFARQIAIDFIEGGFFNLPPEVGSQSDKLRKVTLKYGECHTVLFKGDLPMPYGDLLFRVYDRVSEAGISPTIAVLPNYTSYVLR